MQSYRLTIDKFLDHAAKWFEDAGEQVIAHWDEVTDRDGEIVPAYGFTQADREVASAGLTAPVLERAT